MAFKHGVYTSEVATSILPARSVDSNVVFAVGTAAVDTLEDGATIYVNEPRQYNSYDEYVKEMGWDDDKWDKYSLQELVYSHFALYRGAPLVVVNVYDPKTHTSPDDVTSKDIIGGVDAKTGKLTGLELVDSVFPLFRLVVGSILAPRFCEDPSVAVVMATKAKNINGLFNAIAIADIPCSGDTGVTNYTEVAAYKQNNNLTSERLIVCWPKVKLGDHVYGLATHITGLMSQTDYENDGVPYASVSNKQLQITSIGMPTADGGWEELALGMDKVNTLNGEGIYSALNWDGGLRSWGGRMACYPTNTDPKDCQEPIRRMFNWFQNTFILTYFQKVDYPLTRRLIKTIITSEQIRIDGYTARGMLLGGSIEFSEDENPTTDLIDGIIRFHIRLTPPPAARDIEGTFEFDTDNLSTLFSD